MVNTKHGRFTSVFWRSLGVFLLSVPVAANAVVIDNGVPQGTLGHWSVDVLTGGETTAAFVTAQRFASGDVATPDVVFEYLSFVDPGIDGGGIRLGDLSDAVPDPNDPNIVSSSGSFGGANLNSIDWTASSTIAPGSQVMVTRYTFRTSNGGRSVPCASCNTWMKTFHRVPVMMSLYLGGRRSTEIYRYSPSITERSLVCVTRELLARSLGCRTACSRDGREVNSL
jgi:hypothetical protein